MNEWLVLTATLPTHPSALRVRVWRALKGTGAGTLREGVYVLPGTAATASALWGLERSITEAGAEAHMLVLKARDETQEQAFRRLFDRSELYAELLLSMKEARRSFRQATEVELRKTLRGLEQQLQALLASDFFPGKDGERASAALAALRREATLKLSPDEPSPGSAQVERQSIEDYQGRRWATRKRPWVDRLATAWLIQRFIDRSPRFLWLDDPAKCPKAALGYDFDGARFTHIGDKVTFEVVAQTFGLERDPGISRLGELVHSIDLGGLPMEEAPGIETVVRGMQAQHAADDKLLAAALPLFDSLYAAMKVRP